MKGNTMKKRLDELNQRDLTISNRNPLEPLGK